MQEFQPKKRRASWWRIGGKRSPLSQTAKAELAKIKAILAGAAMADVNRLLDPLEKVKKTGTDRWIARCPAHADKSPSLSIRYADDRILLHCFGG